MLSKKNHIEIDSLDTKILTILAKDAKLSYAEIGKMLYVSPGTVHVRVKKLTEANLIKAVRAELNYAALGFDITAFLGIYLEKSNMYESVKSELKKIPEVIDAHYTTGNYSIFAKSSAEIQNIYVIYSPKNFRQSKESNAQKLSFHWKKPCQDLYI
jgi:Lrp/AsnC family transcriptional regulator for asnA, asnC and gidA